MSAEPKRALLVLDMQNDFCAGGSLEVQGAERIVPLLNRYIDDAVAAGMPVYAVRDWHPPQTVHFLKWPPHCIHGTHGAAFHPQLQLPADVIVVSKGDTPDADAYSAFDGHTADGTPLLTDLQAREIDELVLGGVATDYCVRESTADALAAGLKVTVLTDAIAGVDAEASRRALVELHEQGATFQAGGPTERAVLPRSATA